MDVLLAQCMLPTNGLIRQYDGMATPWTRDGIAVAGESVEVTVLMTYQCVRQGFCDPVSVYVYPIQWV